LQASEQTGDLPDLLGFSESQIGQPVEQWQWNSHRYSRSALNYLLGLSFLKILCINDSRSSRNFGLSLSYA